MLRPLHLVLAQIMPAGTLQPELERAAKSTLYHGVSASALSMLAWVAQANGNDLFSKGGFALRRLTLMLAK